MQMLPYKTVTNREILIPENKKKAFKQKSICSTTKERLEPKINFQSSSSVFAIITNVALKSLQLIIFLQFSIYIKHFYAHLIHDQNKFLKIAKINLTHKHTYHINVTFRDLKENKLYSFSFFGAPFFLFLFLHDLKRRAFFWVKIEEFEFSVRNRW